MLQQNNWPPHITVATVIQDGDRYLMVEEVERDVTVINQPAGHLEAGESLFEAAYRETLEETGWQVELTGFIGFYQYQSPDALFHRFAFAATPLRQVTLTVDPDITAIHWLTRSDIAERVQRSPMVLQCIDDAGKALMPLSVIHEHLRENAGSQ